MTASRCRLRAGRLDWQTDTHRTITTMHALPGGTRKRLSGAWRTDPKTAADVFSASHVRTPEPLRRGRRRAREAHALDNGDDWRERRKR